MNAKTLCKNNNIDLEKIDIVAFDIFDTIIYRKVSPVHVCRMWAEKLIIFYGLNISVDNLLLLRSNIVKKEKAANIIRGKDKEFTYRKMCGDLRKRLALHVSEQDFYEKCLEIELEDEKSVCYVPDSIKILIDELIESKRVICISDFYLPLNILQKLFEYLGIPIKEIFVSSNCLLQKRSGRLYKYVASVLECDPSKILMIGDTETSDYIRAKKCGYEAIWLENQKQRDFYAKFEENFLYRLNEFTSALNSVQSENKPFLSVTYLMIIFIYRLFHKLKEDGCKDVLFMSREGEFFKKLFDVYQDNYISEEERIQTHYFYVSRRATIIPSIHTIDKDSFQEIYKNYSNIRVETFFKNIGLDNNDAIRKEFVDLLNKPEEIYNFAESEEYERILNSKVFITECLKKSEEQRRLFIKYLDDMRIDYREKGLYVVDIGYSGTSQNNIYKVFRGEIKINGYYMISYAENNSIIENNRKIGIVYDKQSGLKKNYFTYNSAVIEMLSLASHCGVDGYKYDSELDMISPIFNHNEQELVCYRDVISKVQCSIIDEFVKISNLIQKFNIAESYYYSDFIERYKKFIYNPSIEEMEEYLTIPFVDNFAIYRTYEASKLFVAHKNFSFKGIIEILKTKGRCLKNQNTHWIAAALYKLDLRYMNIVLLLGADFAMQAFDYMAASEKKKRSIVKERK